MKILYVTTISNTVNAFLIPHIKMLIDEGNRVDVAFNVEQEVDPKIRKLGCKIHNISFQRSPIRKKNYFAYKQLKRIIKTEEYDLVHTHTPVASACVRIACKNMPNTKVVYTAHGFHFYKGAPFVNWALYYLVEKWLSKYTDLLITINQEDFKRAGELLHTKKIEYVPGVGLDITKINNIQVEIFATREELGISDDSFVIVSVGELNNNKNHETVIKAISTLNSSNIRYLICGKGPLESYLNGLIQRLGLEQQVKLLGYRNDVAEICKMADVFVFPSFREGLSVALMESMALGLPVVCSNIRGNSDLIHDGKGGYLVEPSDTEGFVNAINKIIQGTSNREDMAEYNKCMISEFNVVKVIEEMKRIYLEVY